MAGRGYPVEPHVGGMTRATVLVIEDDATTRLLIGGIELDTNTVDQGLWTKTYVQAGGDEHQTRVHYSKARRARRVAMEDAQREAMRREQQKGRV